MAGSGKFTFTFTEKDLSLLAEALETVAEYGIGGSMFTRTEFGEMARRLDERLHW